jgi:hypothetical protein
MNKLNSLLIVIFSIISTSSQAQEKFEKYDNAYFQKEFEIKISKDATLDDFKLYIFAASIDDLWKDGGMIISMKRYDDFINALKSAKQKYSEWVKTAQENKVNDLSKVIPVSAKAEGFFRTGEWHFQKVVNLQFEFKILQIANPDPLHLLIIRTGQLQSSTNQFTKMSGFVLIFDSVAEIEKFEAKISKENISSFLNKPKTDSLFK